MNLNMTYFSLFVSEFCGEKIKYEKNYEFVKNMDFGFVYKGRIGNFDFVFLQKISTIFTV